MSRFQGLWCGYLWESRFSYHRCQFCRKKQSAGKEIDLKMLTVITSGWWSGHFFFFFFLHQAACGILVSWPGIEPRPSAVKVWSPKCWVTKEFPPIFWIWGYESKIRVQNPSVLSTKLCNYFFQTNIFPVQIFFLHHKIKYQRVFLFQCKVFKTWKDHSLLTLLLVLYK